MPAYQYPPAPRPTMTRSVTSRFGQGPRRLRRFGLGGGAGLARSLSVSSSSSRNFGADVRRGGGASGGGGGGGGAGGGAAGAGGCAEIGMSGSGGAETSCGETCHGMCVDFAGGGGAG